MAIVIEDEQRERLAEQIAVAEGVSVTEVVRERLTALACEMDAVPPRSSVDPRSDNDILGYDEHGVW